VADGNSDEDVTFEDPDWVDKILARALESAENPDADDASPTATPEPRPEREPGRSDAPRPQASRPPVEAPPPQGEAPSPDTAGPVDADDFLWSGAEPRDGDQPASDEPTEAHGGWFDDDEHDWDEDGDTVLPENLGRGPSADEVIASWVNEEGDTGTLLVATTDEPAAPKPPKSTARSVAEWGAVIVGALLVALLVKTFLVQAFFIPSASMVPTLNEGDRVLVNKLSYDLGDVSRGDVIVFKRPPSETGSIPDLIKRAIAFEGETIVFRDGEVFIDGQLLIEPYLAEPSSTEAFRTIPGCENEAADSCVIPEGHLFMMGDNRRDSRDSRFFGPVDEGLVIGRAFIKIWPLGDIGGL
jgi:signal peptidase I